MNKAKLQEFPPIEGEESLIDYVDQYKRACLSQGPAQNGETAFGEGACSGA